MSTSLLNLSSGSTILPPIATLPDDALEIILEFVFYLLQDLEDETISPSLSTLRLSHVNRQFRLVALSNAHLWTHISGSKRHPEIGLVNACLERSRGLPLTVRFYVFVDSYGTSCDEVFALAMPHVNRWKTVHMYFVRAIFSPSDNRPTRSLEERDALKNISAPSLENLVVKNGSRTGEYIEFLDRQLSFFKTWIAPALHSLVAINACSFPPTSVQNLTVVDLTLSLHVENTKALLNFLPKMTSLTDLSLSLSTYPEDYHGYERPPDLYTIIMPLHSVRHLRITAAAEQRSLFSDENVDRDFLHALRFPNVLDLEVTFIGKPESYYIPHAKIYLEGALSMIFQARRGNVVPGATGSDYSGSPFPLVSRLHIDIVASAPNYEHRIGETYFSIDLSSDALRLPLEMLPSLEELRIRSNICSLPNLGTHPDQKRVEHHVLRRLEFDIPRLASSLAISSSRSATLPPRWSHWGWLCLLADALSAQGVGHDFEELTVIERVHDASTGGSGVIRRDVTSLLTRDMLFLRGTDLGDEPDYFSKLGLDPEHICSPHRNRHHDFSLVDLHRFISDLPAPHRGLDAPGPRSD